MTAVIEVDSQESLFQFTHTEGIKMKNLIAAIVAGLFATSVFAAGHMAAPATPATPATPASTPAPAASAKDTPAHKTEKKADKKSDKKAKKTKKSESTTAPAASK